MAHDAKTDIMRINGANILVNRHANKSTAFTKEERSKLRIRGLLPPRVSGMDIQLVRMYELFSRCATPLDKYMFLRDLEGSNTTLFYRLMLEHMEEMLPIAYTPTVGEACIKFGHIFQKAHGLYFSLEDLGHADEILANWPEPDVRAIVVSDGGRILGLGDLGASGMGIPIGKLTLFTACGGVQPHQTLPVILDAGTDNMTLRNDPLYLGLDRPRERGELYYQLVDEFVTAAHKRYDHVLIQFEDFGNDVAFKLLETYREKICTFNDDIQGTAAVTLAGLLSMMKEKGTPLKDERFLFLGAGEAATGISDLISTAIHLESGIPVEEARKCCLMVDSRGLVCKSRLASLQEHKRPYAHDIDIPEGTVELIELVKLLKPTAIIGVSGQARSFTEEVVREMAKINERPAIFPLSNPTSCSECTAEEAFRWTDGKCFFASGSPFPNVEYNGRTYCPTQANNVYIFPGVAIGVLASRAKHVTDEMFLIAARTLADTVTEEEKAEARLFPAQSKIRMIAHAIGTRVAENAFQHGLAQIERPDDLGKLVRDEMFDPYYNDLSQDTRW